MTQTVAGMPSRIVSALPVNYSRNKYASCLRLSQRSPLPDFVHRTWPGTTALQWAGFMSNGSGNEDTANSPSPAPFHEIGYFGTTAGPSSNHTCPNNDTGRENDWYHFYNNPQVVALLCRPAYMANGCWRDSAGGFPDQCAVGLVSMFSKYNYIHNSMPAGVRPESPDNIWALALTFMSWSAGPGGTLSHMRPFYDRLRAFPEDQRWDALRRMMAEDLISGRMPIGISRSHSNPAYSVLRTQQKIAAATQNYQDNDIDHAITMAAFGYLPTGTITDGVGGVVAGGTSSLLPLIIGGGLAYTLYRVLQS